MPPNPKPCVCSPPSLFVKKRLMRGSVFCKKSFMKRDLLSLSDLTAPEIEKLLKRASIFKKGRSRDSRLLKGKTLALLFEKASTRTRVSFEVAVHELGGYAVCLEGGTTQVGRGEPYADTARVLSRYVQGIMVRTFGHDRAEELSRAATVPVINGLTDLFHPCQLLADLLTVRELKPRVRKIAYVGDGNNMAHSWIEAAALLKIPLAVAMPGRYGLSPDFTRRVDVGRYEWIRITEDPAEAVKGADVVNTDTWFSMGQQEDEEKRRGLPPFPFNS